MQARWVRGVAVVLVVLLELGCTASGGPSDASCRSSSPSDRGPGHDGVFACSSAQEGTYVCPMGAGSGWSCFRGCWQMFSDGPCAAGSCWAMPGGRCDAGPGDAPIGDACGTIGASGWTCRDTVAGVGGACGSGLVCESERFDDVAARTSPTLAGTLAIAAGEPDADHPGFFRVAASPDPSEAVPIALATGSLCVQTCEVGASVDRCGVCSSCSASVGTTGIVRLPQLLEPAERAFGDLTGWCRRDCLFDPGARGLCPDGHTCSPEENVCVEGCRSDAECQATIVPTWDGGRVSILDPVAGTCDPSTLRCRWTHPGTESVGDACVRDADCTEDVGRCLAEGTCAELDCGRASDTEPGTFVCDGGRGVCLGHGGNEASICVQGCTSAEDCRPGNACVPFEAGATAGSFTGYCIAVCDTVPSDPDGAGPLTEADDVLVACRASERCDVPPATAETPDPHGACRVPCAADADCAAPNRCEMSPSAGQTVCRVPMRTAP